MNKIILLILTSVILTSCASSPKQVDEMILGQHVTVLENRLDMQPSYYEYPVMIWEWSPANTGAVMSELLRGFGMALSNASGNYQGAYSVQSNMRLHCVLKVIVDSNHNITWYELNDRRCL